jgi:hypothetical protein
MCESDERKPEQIREDRYRPEAEPAAPSRVVTITPLYDTGTALAGRRDMRQRAARTVTFWGNEPDTPFEWKAGTDRNGRLRRAGLRITRMG